MNTPNDGAKKTKKKKKICSNLNFAHKFSSIKLASMFQFAYQQHQHRHRQHPSNMQPHKVRKNASKIFGCVYLRTGLRNSMEFRCLALCIVMCLWCCWCCCWCCYWMLFCFMDVVLFSILIMHAKVKSKKHTNNHFNR